MSGFDPMGLSNAVYIPPVILWCFITVLYKILTEFLASGLTPCGADPEQELLTAIRQTSHTGPIRKHH